MMTSGSCDKVDVLCILTQAFTNHKSYDGESSHSELLVFTSCKKGMTVVDSDLCPRTSEAEE